MYVNEQENFEGIFIILKFKYPYMTQKFFVNSWYTIINVTSYSLDSKVEILTRAKIFSKAVQIFVYSSRFGFIFHIIICLTVIRLPIRYLDVQIWWFLTSLLRHIHIIIKFKVNSSKFTFKVIYRIFRDEEYKDKAKKKFFALKICTF